MFSIKNISPRQLSAFTALILVSTYRAYCCGLSEKDWVLALVYFVLLFFWQLFFYLLCSGAFIYRKIKLIYKFIYQTKATKREETYYKYILPQKSIDEVREDVEAWASEKKQEIELLRQNEHFRKEFLQNLSHEFKTPIFAIQGYVDTLLHGALKIRKSINDFWKKLPPMWNG